MGHAVVVIVGGVLALLEQLEFRFERFDFGRGGSWAGSIPEDPLRHHCRGVPDEMLHPTVYLGPYCLVHVIMTAGFRSVMCVDWSQWSIRLVDVTLVGIGIVDAKKRILGPGYAAILALDRVAAPMCSRWLS